MKTFLQTLFYFLLVTQICFAQLHKQTKETNLKKTLDTINLQNKLLPIIDRNIHIETSHKFEVTNYKNRLQKGFDASYMKSISIPLLNNRFLPNQPKRNLSPTYRISSPQSHIYVIDTAIVIQVADGYLPADTTRHLYSFNASAKRTSDLEQKLIGEYWVNTTRNTNTYDAQGNMLTNLYEIWDNDQWVNGWRYTYIYDTQGNMLTELDENWENGQWVNSWRYTYIYDTQGNMLTSLSEGWQNGEWVNYYHLTYTYNAQGNMLTDLYKRWEYGQWVESWRYTYTYDAQENMLTALQENCEIGQWINYLRFTYTYDAQGNMLTRLSENWENGQWINYWRRTYTYNAQGNMLTWLHEECEHDQWLNGSRNTYTYDAYGNMLTSLSEDWENGQWVNYCYITQACDILGNLTSYWIHTWLESTWVPMNEYSYSGFEMYDMAGNEYRFWGHNFTFIYKLIITEAMSENSNAPGHYTLWQNYPNPFNPSTTIEFTLPKISNVRIEVYNIAGQKVKTLVNKKLQAGNHQVEYNAENFSSGVYFYRIEAGEFQDVKKMILLR